MQKIDEKCVEETVAGGGFFKHLPPGKKVVGITTEATNSLTLVLGPNETKYVKTTVSFGLLVGHFHPNPVDPVMGRKGLQKLVYTGKFAKKSPD